MENKPPIDWHQKYLEKTERRRHKDFTGLINARRLRYKVNQPIKQEHFSELVYLLLNYDANATLLRKYEEHVSEEVKSQWLATRLRMTSNMRYSLEHLKIYRTLLPFYLINPQTRNPQVDKHFLRDQLLLILGGLDHKYSRFRWRAHYLFEFLVPNFRKLLPGYRSRVVKLLIDKANSQNIRQINWLIGSNSDIIDLELIDFFIQNQLKKKIVTPRMAIGYLKRFHSISLTNKEKLKALVLRLEKGAYILEKTGL